VVKVVGALVSEEVLQEGFWPVFFDKIFPLIESDILAIKVLIVLRTYSARISGGYRRTYEILKRGRSHGIKYVIVTDWSSFKNSSKMFPDFQKVCKQYATYFVDPQNITIGKPDLFLNARHFTRYFQLSLILARIAKLENVDLLVGIGETPQTALISYLSGQLSGKPWTNVLQGDWEIFQPTKEIGPLNPFNVIRHINDKEQTKKLSLKSKLGIAIGLLTLLRTSQKSLILTVSSSLHKTVSSLNPRITFQAIVPGIGLDLEKIDSCIPGSRHYDIVFLSRLTPEKGLFDLPTMFERITKERPKARIAVAGFVEDQSVFNVFLQKLVQLKLVRNVDILDASEEDSYLNVLRSGKILVFPSQCEAYGLVILEALACGTPAVTYDLPSIRQNYKNVKAVLKCPMNNPLRMAEMVAILLKNNALWKQLSVEAREYVSDFGWEKVVVAEREAYLAVIKGFSRNKPLDSAKGFN
jgi:glycosyltransferase involved in cell wall biosynthesis